MSGPGSAPKLRGVLPQGPGTAANGGDLRAKGVIPYRTDVTGARRRGVLQDTSRQLRGFQPQAQTQASSITFTAVPGALPAAISCSTIRTSTTTSLPCGTRGSSHSTTAPSSSECRLSPDHSCRVRYTRFRRRAFHRERLDRARGGNDARRRTGQGDAAGATGANRPPCVKGQRLRVGGSRRQRRWPACCIPVAAVGRPFPTAARAGEVPANGRVRLFTGTGPPDEPGNR